MPRHSALYWPYVSLHHYGHLGITNYERDKVAWDTYVTTGRQVDVCIRSDMETGIRSGPS